MPEGKSLPGELSNIKSVNISVNEKNKLFFSQNTNSSNITNTI